nr:reverse transcriptase domain-containing protein [Tanacetum cinerariifolium]
MSTRSSARNLFTPLDNPELTIRRRSRTDPTLLNDSEMAAEGNDDLPVPDLRTMKELCQPSLNGRGGPIAPIAIQAMNFGLKKDMIQQVKNFCQFHGLPGDDANNHLDKFLHVTQSIKVNGVTDDALRLYLFPHSLTHHATAWFDHLPRNSINTFKKMAKLFLDIFYNGLTLRHRDTINAAAGGTFMKRHPEEFYDLIENMTAHNNDWDTSTQLTTVGHTQNVYVAGAYQGNIITNPNEDLKGITTRSGTAYQGPMIPTTSSSLPSVVERETEVTKDTMHPTNNGRTEDVQPPVVQTESLILNSEPVINPVIEPVASPVSAPKPNQRPSIPYPSRLHDQKLRDKANDQREKIFQIFKDLNFNISFDDALILMPKFGPSIKSLLTNKDKLCELTRTPLNEHCSAVLLKKFPEKLGDPDKFLIPCDFPRMAKCLALADLDASINLMPLSVWNKLSLPDLPPTCMALELVDHFDADPRVPLILGRSFLKTERAIIDVFEGELTLRVGKEAITFNLDQTSRYSTNYNDMTANRIDVIDMACEEYSQEVLSFSDVIASGNPTPYYDPIVSTTSSTLTPFGESDFLLEEVDAFLALEDDLTSPKVNQSYELKIYEAKTNKSSIDEPHEVELKDLPLHLEYVFLEGDDKLPVIIVKDLSIEEKTALITEDFEPAVQHQGRVNPKIHDVIKNEVLKLLDAGLIYSISDSPWEKTTFTCPYGTLVTAACLLGYAMHRARFRDLEPPEPLSVTEERTSAMTSLQRYREDSNEAAFAVATVEKIYAHESLTFNDTVSYEVISKWKAGLKEDMNARLVVYMLSNDCWKNNDDINGYYWEYTPLQDYALKDVIENGNSFKPVAQTTTNDAGTSTTLIPGLVTTEEKYKDAKSLFAAIETIFGGNEATKKTQMTLLKQMYKNFSATSTDTANTKVSTASSQTSTANLSDATVYAFLANQSNGSQLVHEDLEQIHEDDLVEMDLKWKLALLSMRAKRYQDSSRRTMNEDEIPPKAMVAIDGVGFDWSYMAKDEVPTNMALMAFLECELDLSISGLEEFQQPEFEGYGSKTSKSVCKDISNEVKEYPDALLVKDKVSDNKDCSVESLVVVEKKTDVPTIAKVEFVRPKQQEKPVRKPVKYAEMYKSQGHRGNQRNWNNLKSQQLGSNFVMYNKACFVCGSFEHVQANYNYHQRKRVVWRPTKPDGALITLKRHNYIDVQGRFKHITGNMSYLFDFKKFDEGYVTFREGANGGRITSKGTLKTSKLDFEDVYFVKELKFNLLSVSQMCEKSNSVLFTDTGCFVLSPDFMLTNKSHVLLKVPRRNNIYTVDMKNIVLKESLTCLVAKATLDESMLWHRRLGHINFKNINKLDKDKLVRGLPSKHFKNDQTCVACLKGKQHKASCKSKIQNSISQPLFMLHMDLFGPTFNRVLVVKPQNKTPYELFRGRTLALSFMRPLGCHVTILNTLDHLGKFDGKADEGYFIGYSMNSKDFRVYNIRTRRVEENLHIEFSENKPIVAGVGPEWMFDIDMLTKSMNYVPFNAGINSDDFAGTKDSIGAGQSKMETGSTQDYIFMPLWKDG